MKLKILGQRYLLKVTKLVDFGVYLDADNLGEILLPRKQMLRSLNHGDAVDVFIYRDSEDRLIATTQQVKVSVGEFAYLKVSATSEFGAFLDWGLDKDLLVPFAEQHRPMEVGQSYIVYVYVNLRDDRITASSKIDKFLDQQAHSFKADQAVELIIANSTELGHKAIINHSHWGVLFKNELFQRLSFGQRKKGFIKRVRDDGKIDLSLQGGQDIRDKNAHLIERYLKKHDGFAAIHDKSDPALISKEFGISKNAFKKAIGALFKRQVIRIDEDGIRLAHHQPLDD